MELSWSTPLRRDDAGTPLPLIANEIYLEIFEHILPPGHLADSETLETLRRLALVCGFFRHLALPHLFERTVFDGDRFRYKTDVGKRAWARAVAACEPAALNAAALVRQVVFRDRNEAIGAVRMWAIPFAELYNGPVFIQMVHLGRVEFVHCMVTAHHVSTLRQLPRLRRVAFRECTWDTKEGGLATLDPRADGGLGSPVEEVELEFLVASSISDWIWKALAATPSLRRVAAGQLRMLREIGCEGDLMTDTPKVLGHVREVCVRFPPNRADDFQGPMFDMFDTAQYWLISYPALERLVLFTSWPHSKLRLSKPLDRPQKLIQVITDLATAKFHCLRRLEFLDPGFDDTHLFFQTNHVNDVLGQMVRKVCPKLEYFRFGPLEWTLQSGVWVQVTRTGKDEDVFG